MSEDLLSKRVQSIEPSLTLEISAKANELASRGEDICNLSAGEPDFEAPKEVIEATSRALYNGFTKYGPAAGDLELRNAISIKLQSQNNIDINFQNVMITNGAKQALFSLFQILLNDGDEVIIPAPYWLSYPQMVKLAGGKPIILQTTAESGFKINIEDIKSKISNKTKCLIINSPNNPTGKVLTKDELQKIIEFVRENRNLNIISDEIYELIINKELKHHSLAAMAPDIKDRIFTINGFAKGWAMTGWRIGYLVGNEKVIKASSSLQSQSTSNVCSFVQKGAIAALNLKNEYFLKINAEYDQKRKVLFNGLKNINGIYLKEPKGAFYAFPRLPNNKISSVEFCKRAIEDFGLVIVPGKAFGNDQCIRISCANSIDKLKDGIKRFESSVMKYY